MINFPDYDSPINIMIGNLETKIENEAIKAVQQVGITIDKDELISAIRQDAERYRKAFRMGEAAARREAGREWIRCADDMPKIPYFRVTPRGEKIVQEYGGSVDVIVCDEYGQVFPLVYAERRIRGNKTARWEKPSGALYYGTVEYWRPLPDPPGVYDGNADT